LDRKLKIPLLYFIQNTHIHPDNDPSITYCSRCGCPPDTHEIIIWETEKELGADAYSLHQWDTAIIHYTRAIDLHQTDATLWTNRAASYLAKGWHAQALYDAEHAASLRPDWFRPWARKGAALVGLHKPEQALKAYKEALHCAKNDHSVNETTISGIQTALRDVEKKIHSVSDMKKSIAITAPIPLKMGNINDKREILNPKTPAHTEQIKTELSSSFPNGCDGRRPSAASTQSRDREENEKSGISSNPSLDKSVDTLINVASPPSSYVLTGQLKMFAEVEVQYMKVVKQVERLKVVMDKLHQQLLLHDTNNLQPQMHQEMITIDTGIESDRGTRRGCTRSQGTEDGDIRDIDSNHEEEEDLSIPSSPLLKRKVNAKIDTEENYEDGVRGRVDEHEQQSPRQEHQDRLVDQESNLDNSSSENEFDVEFEWLDTVQAARKQLLGVDETNEYGFVPPPPRPFSSSFASLSSRRQPKNTAQPAKEATTSPNIGTFDTTTTTTNINISKNDSDTSKVDLGSLQSLLALSAAQQSRKDPFGTERYACKTCGPGTCVQYYANTSTNRVDRQQMYAQKEHHFEASQQLHQSRHCSRCGCDCTGHETEEEATAREIAAGCDCTGHETEEEATAREIAAQQAKERKERIKKQREEREQQRQRHHQPPPSPETQRMKRVVTAAARKAASEEAGEPLQCTDCDIITQSKRGTCISCKACSGFKIYYKSTDANNPEVMLFCSVCGCASDSHPVDSSWEQQESARREAENAAGARAAARARHSFNAQAAASAAAQKEEADAYAALGLRYGADATAVTRAYKRLALKLHPDKVNIARRNSGQGQGDQGGETEAAAHAAFVKVTQAYKLLSNLKS